MTTTAPSPTLPDVDEFRARARAWLAENAERLTSGGVVNRMQSREHRIAIYDAGFGGITWPVEYGGLGLTGAHQEAFTEEAANYPDLVVGDLVTAGICAPTLLDFGSEEQKRRYIPHMLRGDEVWTQLLSEPGAGSDLAGLQTKAVLDGDEWVVNGQKVWTSGAMASEFAILIARSNPDVPKHQGLSMFMVDLKAPGVTIRPLKQMTGNDEFNEVFLDDVRLPADYLVGAKDDGWRALLRMLMHERMAIGAGTSGSRMGRDMFTTFRDLARARGVDQNEGVRAALLDVYIKEHLLSWLGQRMRDGAAQGKEPGPEGSLAKLLNAIVSRASSNAGMAIGGASAQAWEPEEKGAGVLAAAFLQAPMTAIAGGTSEIQRNTIGERVLGLPKEPQTDRDIPFRDVLKNERHRKRHPVDDYQYVAYETLDEGTIARIMLNRPESRNAQHRGLLVELDDVFLRAEADDTVRVVILGGAGPIFSSGHDMGSKDSIAQRMPGPDQHPTFQINGATRKGAEMRMLQEWHYFFENTKRWRDLRKITIAQVNGTVYAAGLMLMWACDLIVAADDARFSDVVGTRLGMCGVEYFAHPWEFGPRKTKELMLTGDAIDAEEAHQLGMVSKIFPTDELADRTLEFARRIAALPTMTALLIKESVNQSVDCMGFQNALSACFMLHQLNHAHWAEVHEDHRAVAAVEDGVPNWKDAPPIVLATKDEVRADA